MIAVWGAIMIQTLPACESLESRTLLSAGQLDRYFGDGGLARLNVGGFRSVHDLLTLDDGRILASVSLTHPIPDRPNEFATSIGLVRLTRDGVADRTFGVGDGVLDTGIDTVAWRSDLLLQPDGKVLFTDGRSLARFNPDGSPDTTFGAAGTGRIDMGASSAGLALQLDGRILVGGARDGILYAQRFFADGTPDNSFSADSVATVRGASGRPPAFSGIALMPNGTIYLGCTWVVVPMGENTENAVYAYDVVHLRANGTLDTAYGPNGTGIVERRMGVYIGMHGALMVDAHERAYFGVMTDLRHMIRRYDRTGALDTTYGTNGQFGALGPATTIDAQHMMLQHDGAVIAGGSLPDGTAPGGPGPDQFVNNPALARATRDGKVDTAFGNDGRAVAHLPGAIPESNDRHTAVQAMTIAGDGSILAASRDRDGAFAVMRFWRDDAPAAEFSAKPIAPPYQRSFVFTVTYRDADDALDLATLDNRDVRVTGPPGYVRYAKFDRAAKLSDGRVVARYKLGAPGGAWGAGNNGVYTFRLRGAQVADVAGRFATARTIGKFAVVL